MCWPIDVESIRKVFAELPYVFPISFKRTDRQNSEFLIGIKPKQRYWISIGGIETTDLPDLNAAFQLVEN